jgi:hypothetical protein
MLEGHHAAATAATDYRSAGALDSAAKPSHQQLQLAQQLQAQPCYQA